MTEERAPEMMCGPTAGCGRAYPMVRAVNVFPASWTLPARCPHCGKENVPNVFFGAAGPAVVVSAPTDARTPSAAGADYPALLTALAGELDGNPRWPTAPDRLRALAAALGKITPEDVETIGRLLDDFAWAQRHGAKRYTGNPRRTEWLARAASADHVRALLAALASAAPAAGEVARG